MSTSTNAAACCGTAAEHDETGTNAFARSYYQPGDLNRFGEIGRANAGLADAFFDYYGKVMAPGLLTAREKSLIGLAVVHALKCPYCIDAYANKCIDQGISEAEMYEAVHIAGALAAGVTLVHSTQMLNHIDARGKAPAAA
ncbi:MAG: arsenosugar biosynthesis-associated peroxidase-like protein [Verrucomicrobiae bacterium]|nr:arsenosugar biosynthesis-associated peroxidase-like protein [Verrucomicrobiae bacterium]